MPHGATPDGAGRPAFGWLVRLIAVSAAVLVPWAAYLALSLPASVSARHWPVVWAGLDVVMAAGLAATAWLAVRRDRRMAFPAVSTATLLLVDAWFDVCTAPAGAPLVMALAGTCIEVAEAAGCLALAVAVWRTSSCVATPRGAARRPVRHLARARRNFRSPCPWSSGEVISERVGAVLMADQGSVPDAGPDAGPGAGSGSGGQPGCEAPDAVG